MNIILVSGNLGKVRTLTVSGSQLALAGIGLLVAVTLAVAAVQWVWLRHATPFESPAMQSLMSSVNEDQQRQTESQLRQSLNAMAVRLGQMQAQLLRLDG